MEERNITISLEEYKHLLQIRANAKATLSYIKLCDYVNTDIIKVLLEERTCKCTKE